MILNVEKLCDGDIFTNDAAQSNLHSSKTRNLCYGKTWKLF